MKSYVYAYVDPRKRGIFNYPGVDFTFMYEPYYIGKGKGHRIYAHICESAARNSTLKHKTINEIVSDGFDIRSYIIKLKTELSDSDSFDIERNIVKSIGRFNEGKGPLLNLVEGGNGGFVGNIFKVSDEFSEYICKTYERSATLQEVATECSVSISTVWFALKDKNIPIRNSRKPKIEHMKNISEDLCKEYLEGASSVTLSAKYGIDHKSVTKILELNKIPRRPAGRYSKTNLAEQIKQGQSL